METPGRRSSFPAQYEGERLMEEWSGEELVLSLSDDSLGKGTVRVNCRSDWAGNDCLNYVKYFTRLSRPEPVCKTTQNRAPAGTAPRGTHAAGPCRSGLSHSRPRDHRKRPRPSEMA